MTYHTIEYYIILYHTILHYVILCYTIWYYYIILRQPPPITSIRTRDAHITSCYTRTHYHIVYEPMNICISIYTHIIYEYVVSAFIV